VERKGSLLEKSEKMLFLKETAALLGEKRKHLRAIVLIREYREFVRHNIIINHDDVILPTTCWKQS
jgi:hypothetical protein